LFETSKDGPLDEVNAFDEVPGNNLDTIFTGDNEINSDLYSNSFDGDAYQNTLMPN